MRCFSSNPEGRDSQVRDVVRSGIGSFIASSAGMLCGILLQLYLANVLGAKAFGYYAYAIACAMGMSVVSKLGFETSTLRVIPAALATADWSAINGFRRFSSNIVVVLSVFVAAGVAIVVFASGRLESSGVKESLICALLLAPLLAALELRGAQLQALKRNIQYQLMYGVIRPVIIVLFVITAGHLSGSVGAPSALIGNAVAAGAVLALCGWSLREHLRASAQRAIPLYQSAAWIRLTIPFALIGVSQYLLARADLLVTGIFSDAISTGAYAVANQLAMLVTFGIGASNVVMAPTIAELYAKRNLLELQQTLRASQRLILAYTFTTLVVLGFFGKSLLSFFGSEFEIAYGPLLLLAAGQCVIAWCGPVGFLMTMTAHQNEALAIIVVGALVQIILLFILVPMFGIWGAAAGSAAANALRSIVLAVVVARRLKLHAFAA